MVVDDLASRVLVLNLPARGDGLGEWLTGAARLGVPLYVTLHQLVELPVAGRPLMVYVCENPAVLRRAAAELGAGSAPLVCIGGTAVDGVSPSRGGAHAGRRRAAVPR